MKKIDYVWLGAAVLTYDKCLDNENWKLDDIYFGQSDILKKAEEIAKDKIINAYVNQLACAHSNNQSRKNIMYLVARNTQRRISYVGEFDGKRERPIFDGEENNIAVETKHGSININILLKFVEKVFTPRIKRLLEEHFSKYDLGSVFDYINEYAGKDFIAVERAGNQAAKMEAHKNFGSAVRSCIKDFMEEIRNCIPRYEKLDISGWINQGQRTNEYMWAQLRKKEKEKLPTSIAVLFEKLKIDGGESKFRLRISVEAQDSRCVDDENSSAEEKYYRHARLLNVPKKPGFDYYMDGPLPDEIITVNKAAGDIREQIRNSENKKVQICKLMSETDVRNKTAYEVFKFVSRTIYELEPYYDAAVDNIDEKTMDDGEADAVLMNTKFSPNMILYGPPGTGKTYNTIMYAVAICDCLSLDEVKTKNYAEVKARFDELMSAEHRRIAFTTFHQSYGYEEFIEGIRPIMTNEGEMLNGDKETGQLKYRVIPGIFKAFCDEVKKAAKIKENTEPYVFIIDEINRGNISKIFGELITLIEDTKRLGTKEQASAVLPYSGEEFSVPSNVYILGTMNTADRSIALMDTALRRRFAFVEMMPDTALLKGITVEQNDFSVDVEKMLNTINKRIEFLFDREHTIGHAFFMRLKENPNLDILASIFKCSIVPLLQEYFYEDYEKIQLVLGDNGKIEDEFKFIKNETITPSSLFLGRSRLEKSNKYTINESAFRKIESYIGIYDRNNNEMNEDEE